MLRRGPMLLLALMVLLAVSASAQTKGEPSEVRPWMGPASFETTAPLVTARWPRQRTRVQGLETDSSRSDGTFAAQWRQLPCIHVHNIIMFGADDLVPAHGSKDMPIWGRYSTRSILIGIWAMCGWKI